LVNSFGVSTIFLVETLNTPPSLPQSLPLVANFATDELLRAVCAKHSP
jgi:hypothetical protein